MFLNKKKVRRVLWNEQQGKCCWCNKSMRLEEATIEHIKARAVGGTDDVANLQVACEKCNHERGERLSKALQEEERLLAEQEARQEERRKWWSKHRKPLSKVIRKPPRGRKRVVDRFPPPKYYRYNGLEFE